MESLAQPIHQKVWLTVDPEQRMWSG